MAGNVALSPSNYSTPQIETTYMTPSKAGADYSLGGQIANWFTGKNAEAENTANAYNTALTEYRERAYNSAEAEKARDWSSSEAEKAREWSAHSYSRMVKDAKEAGINPLYLVGSSVSNTSPTASSSASASSGGSRPSFSKNTNSADKLASFAGQMVATAAKIAVFASML